MKKLFLIPFILVIFIFGFSSGIEYCKKQATQVQDVENNKNQTVNLMIDYGSGEIVVFNKIEFAENDSVFEIMKSISSANDFELKYKEYGGEMGIFIEAIDGRENNFKENTHWQYWINGEYAKIGAGSQKLNGGEVIEWKYTKGQVDN